MAKGQKRSNRETKKPKQQKSASSATSSLTLTPAPTARELLPPGGRDRTGPRNGRR